MRRLICISNSIADTFKWRTSMGLTNHHVRHWSPYENPNKMRGLSEVNNAIVWVDRPALSSDHYLVLDRYRALSMREFEGTQRAVILDWLRADPDPSVSIDDNVRRAHDCGEYVVAKLVQIIRVAVTCAAIEHRIVTYLRQRAPQCADARRHALEDIAWELEIGYHRKEVR